MLYYMKVVLVEICIGKGVIKEREFLKSKKWRQK